MLLLTAWATARPLVPLSLALVNVTCTHSTRPLVPVFSMFVCEGPFVPCFFSALVNSLDIFCVQPTVLAPTMHISHFLSHTDLLRSSSASYFQKQSCWLYTTLLLNTSDFSTPCNRHYSFLCIQLTFLRKSMVPDFPAHIC